MSSHPASGGETRLALTAGIGCYLIWGLVPLLFQVLGHAGAGPWEILSHRTVWGAPVALVFLLAARQGRHLGEVLRQPRTLAWLTLSSVLVAVNWSTFIWAVNRGRVLETSLGYYILPLLNMAAGALFFRERISRAGKAAIALATVGVALQAVALGHLPLVSLALALSFGGYGVVRKRIPAEAQTGLLIECALLTIPCAAYLVWIQHAGTGRFFAEPGTTALFLLCGPATAAPLMLFAWAARRIPLSAMGFLQFITPTMTFALGLHQGEAFSPLRALSFGFIWAGVAVFALAAWRRSRSVRAPAAAAAAREAA